MKKLLLLAPFLVFLAACSNEFDVTANWKEIPVAYAFLSPQDTAHYIRVEKAFLDPEKSALEIAQIPDSLYYPESDIAVYLQRVSTNQLFQLYRVDGTQEGFPRKGGIFATQPNYLYKIRNTEMDSLRRGEPYRLVIKRADGQPDITAQTTIPRDFAFQRPNPSMTPPTVFFDPGENVRVEWRGDTNSTYFNLMFNIRYREESGNGSVLGRDTLTWVVATNLKRGSSIINTSFGPFYRTEHLVPSDNFFRFLADNIQPTTDKFRYFEFMSITLLGGGKEIEDLLLVASANAGLTGAEILPAYTNLSEGFGLFTARNSTTLQNVLIDIRTVDKMNQSPLTQGLNFRY